MGITGIKTLATRGKRRSSLTFSALSSALCACAALSYGGVDPVYAQPVQLGGDSSSGTATATGSAATPGTSTTPAPAAESPASTPPANTPDATSATAGSANPTAAAPTPAQAPVAMPEAQPIPEPQPAHPPHPSQIGQGRRGFVVTASFGVRPYFTQSLNAGSVSTEMTSSLQGGLGIGFKTGRVVLTLGLDLGSIDVRDTFTYRTTATFLVVPGLQVAIARSRDHRVELVGSLRIGAGSTMSTDATSTSKPPALVMYELAPAVRYWAHRQFAVQFLGGYGGQYQITSGSVGNTSIGRHGLAASIGAIGIF